MNWKSKCIWKNQKNKENNWQRLILKNLINDKFHLYDNNSNPLQAKRINKKTQKCKWLKNVYLIQLVNNNKHSNRDILSNNNKTQNNNNKI